MNRFEIFTDATAIGYAELTRFDPPMGVAYGRFIPLPAYESVQSTVIASRDSSQEHLMLSVHTSEGTILPAEGGVRINDYSDELGADGLEIEVLGIPYLVFEELFPGRHAEYVAQFQRPE